MTQGQTTQQKINVEMLAISKGKPGGEKGHPDHQIASGFFGPRSRDLQDVPKKNLRQGQEEDASAGDNTDPSYPTIDLLHKPSERFRGRLRIEPPQGRSSKTSPEIRFLFITQLPFRTIDRFEDLVDPCLINLCG